MDAVRLGHSLRALRIRLGWRQVDVARRVGLSRGTISNIERGRCDGVAVGTLRQVSHAVGADIDVRIRWRGAELDRLLDAGHVRLVSKIVDRLSAFGWHVAVETTFSIWGERGSMDILAFHPQTSTLLVVEVKTIVPDFQAMVAGLDRKARLAPIVARDRGWDVLRASRLLVIEDGSTSRDRIRRSAPAASAALPDRGMDVRTWIRRPSGTLAGLLFVRSANEVDAAQRATGRQRVRRPGNHRSATESRVPRKSTAAPDPLPA